MIVNNIQLNKFVELTLSYDYVRNVKMHAK